MGRKRKRGRRREQEEEKEQEEDIPKFTTPMDEAECVGRVGWRQSLLCIIFASKGSEGMWEASSGCQIRLSMRDEAAPR